MCGCLNFAVKNSRYEDSTMVIECGATIPPKLLGKNARMGRYFKQPNFRTRYKGNVTADDEGCVFLFGYDEAGPVLIESRFHFFEAELTEEDWARVRKRHQLSKKMRHT